MRRRARERWPLLASAALALLAAYGLTPLGDVERWRDASLLGVPAEGWGLVACALVLAIGGQLASQGRESLRRQRRLVGNAAQLRMTGAELEALAMTDALIGLLNRRRFAERLDVEFGRAERYGRSVAVLMLDIDHFKRVNDSHGHPAGDAVLMVVARTLRAEVRVSDLVARYRGEEFAVMLPETGLQAATVVGEKLRAAVGPAHAQGAAPRVTVSVGVAAYPDCVAGDADALVRLVERGGSGRVAPGTLATMERR